MLVFHRILFPMPNPAHPLLVWRADLLSSLWDLLLLVVGILAVVSYWWYYFRTMPDPGGTVRFGWLSVAILAAGTALSFILIYSSRDSLLVGGRQWTFAMALHTMMAGLAATLVILVLVIGIYLLLGIAFPRANWQLRAMRRYPFRKIP